MHKLGRPPSTRHHSYTKVCAERFHPWMRNWAWVDGVPNFTQNTWVWLAYYGCIASQQPEAKEKKRHRYLLHILTVLFIFPKDWLLHVCMQDDDRALRRGLKKAKVFLLESVHKNPLNGLDDCATSWTTPTCRRHSRRRSCSGSRRRRRCPTPLRSRYRPRQRAPSTCMKEAIKSLMVARDKDETLYL